MAYKDKEKQKEAQRKAMAKKRKGFTEEAQKVHIAPLNVKPDVKPTDVDIVTGTPWTMRDGTPGNPNVGVLGRTWRTVPCVFKDGVCVAAHHDGQHEVASQEAPVSLPLVRFLKADPSNLSKLQRIAGSLGKLAGEVRFGIDGPTFEDLGETIGVKPPIHAK